PTKCTVVIWAAMMRDGIDLSGAPPRPSPPPASLDRERHERDVVARLAILRRHRRLLHRVDDLIGRHADHAAEQPREPVLADLRPRRARLGHSVRVQQHTDGVTEAGPAGSLRPCTAALCRPPPTPP